MKDYFITIKLVLVAIGSFIAEGIGGWNAVLSLLLTLMIVDLITGFLYAFIKKEVSSTKMRDGIIHKMIIAIAILVGYRLNLAIIGMFGNLPSIGGIQLDFKMFVTCYACFEELCSVIENIANCGVPVPKFIKTALAQVDDTVNNSTPTEILALVRRVLSFFGKNGDKSDTDTPE